MSCVARGIKQENVILIFGFGAVFYDLNGLYFHVTDKKLI
jgi:hypothetical protein